MNKRLLIVAVAVEGLLAVVSLLLMFKGTTWGHFMLSLWLQWPGVLLLSAPVGIEGKLSEIESTLSGVVVCLMIFVIQTYLIWLGLLALRLFISRDPRKNRDGWQTFVYAPWKPSRITASEGKEEANQRATDNGGAAPRRV